VNARLAPLALTMGEPAGIAAEITLKAWRQLRAVGPAFCYVGPSALLAATALRLGIDNVPLQAIGDAGDAHAVFSHALPVIELALPGEVTPGKPSAANAGAVIGSIEQAVDLARQGHISAVVTNPIQKSVLQQAGFAHPGHTEFLQQLAAPGGRATMLLAGPELRVVPVTIHQSLKSALAALDQNMIVETALAAAAGLAQDFGISAPRLAVAGLNPHAGEDGHMGDEEIRIIRPAVEVLRRRGIDATGPWSPDTMFAARARRRYDAAICMYHDQALIPLKTLDVNGGVNVTLGLPFVRTSPDHGTALDIAGKGIAEPGSLISALRLAGQLALNRRSTMRGPANAMSNEKNSRTKDPNYA
jgi:4-hydroxythreonine-4-phosphate dehydrogenase